MLFEITSDEYIRVQVEDWLVGNKFQARVCFPHNTLTLTPVNVSSRRIKVKIPESVWEKMCEDSFICIGRVYSEENGQEKNLALYSVEENLEIFQQRRLNTYKIKALYWFAHNPDASPSAKELKEHIGCSYGHARSMIDEFKSGPVQIWENKYQDAILKFEGEYKGDYDDASASHYTQREDNIKEAIRQLLRPKILEEFSQGQVKSSKETMKEWNPTKMMEEDKSKKELLDFHKDVEDMIGNIYDEKTCSLREISDYLDISLVDLHYILLTVSGRYGENVRLSFYVFLVVKVSEITHSSSRDEDEAEDVADLVLWQLSQERGDVPFLKEEAKESISQDVRSLIELLDAEENRYKAFEEMMS